MEGNEQADTHDYEKESSSIGRIGRERNILRLHSSGLWRGKACASTNPRRCRLSRRSSLSPDTFHFRLNPLIRLVVIKHIPTRPHAIRRPQTPLPHQRRRPDLNPRTPSTHFALPTPTPRTAGPKRTHTRIDIPFIKRIVTKRVLTTAFRVHAPAVLRVRVRPRDGRRWRRAVPRRDSPRPKPRVRIRRRSQGEHGRVV